MENILITLDQLGIGGVETAVVNQVKALKKLNKNVFVMCKNGFYVDTIKSFGAHFIEYEFTDKTYYDKKEIEFITGILRKNKITEVHINQFTAMSSIMPACILANIPYIAYLHMGVGFINNPDNNPFDYFEKQFFTYKKMFEMYFKNATAIITVTDVIKDYAAQRYNIDKNKIIVKPNSIDTLEFKSTKKVKKVNNIFLIGRISEEKEKSIKNGIDLYSKIKEKNKKAKLTIAGDGPSKQTIEKYVQEKEIEDVVFLGAISNVKEEVDKNDLVIGQGRCLLEAISMNKLAIISGYDNIKGFVNDNNFDICIKDNFTGKSLKDKTIKELASEIMGLKEKNISNIINNNYKELKEKLDTTKTLFCLKEEDFKGYDNTSIILDMIELSEILGKQEIEYHNKADDIWKTLKALESRVQKKYGKFEKYFRFVKAPTKVIRRIFKKQ